MQHEPHGLGLVEADLHEVIAGPQGSQVQAIVALADARMFVRDTLEARYEVTPRGVDIFRRRVAPGALVARTGRLAVRHGLFDGRTHGAEAVRQVAGGERGFGGDHAAADVHAHGGRDHRTQRGDHAADGRALADVHVRHDGNVLVDERHLCRHRELLARLVFHGHAARPHLDVGAALDVHGLVDRLVLSHVHSPGFTFLHLPRTLAEAGRRLFGVSRTRRSVVNDSDRLKKYLRRFGLDWSAVRDEA